MASDKCLGIYGNVSDNAQQAIQWDCNGNADQMWYIDSTGGSAQLRNGSDWNKCLTISGGGNGARTVLASCNHQTTQLWY